MTNYKYGKISEDGELVYAPSQIVTSKRAIPCPTAETYAQYGFLPIVLSTDMAASDGTELVRAGWKKEDDAIYAVYEERELPPPSPRRWTPLTVIRGLKAAGLWEQLMTDMSQTDMYEFAACMFIAEDDPLFVQKRNQMNGLIGQDKVDAFLDSLEVFS